MLQMSTMNWGLSGNQLLIIWHPVTSALITARTQVRVKVLGVCPVHDFLYEVVDASSDRDRQALPPPPPPLASKKTPTKAWALPVNVQWSCDLIVARTFNHASHQLSSLHYRSEMICFPTSNREIPSLLGRKAEGHGHRVRTSKADAK